jgi:hypothetical protein
MKILIAAIVVAGAGLLGAASSQAMSIAPVQQVATPVIKVIEGCGPNGHRGPGGNCRPRYSCPPGWHPGPEGWHCFRN